MCNYMQHLLHLFGERSLVTTYTNSGVPQLQISMHVMQPLATTGMTPPFALICQPPVMMQAVGHAPARPVALHMQMMPAAVYLHKGKCWRQALPRLPWHAG
jgi:hypothetical protein